MVQSVFFYETGIGRIGIAENGIAITHLFFPREAIPSDTVVSETPLLRNAYGQLENYLAGEQKVFTLPLAPARTEFSQRVSDCLLTIPYGETRNYREIAGRLGNPEAPRAVGRACRNNPLPIFIPCHRVVGSDGSLRGYRGGLSLKDHLLHHEKQFLSL